ncbi:cadherin-17 [Eleutherodactylus coqui]|uniref:cadherin-17 n=1 Tax=Eleutherodactylus coqui TaxID=57060 RepID=UPI003462841F
MIKMSKLKDFLILLYCMQAVVSQKTGPFTSLTIHVQEAAPAAEIYKFDKQNQRSAKFVLEGEKDGIIEMEPYSGKLITTGPLNWEMRQIYVLKAKTLDSNELLVEGPHSITIIVDDINNNVPFFNQSKYNAEVREQARPDIPFIRVFATDKDDPATPNAQLVYQITQQIPDPARIMFFQINNVTGEISTTSAGTQNIKFGDKPYELFLEVSDRTERPFSDTTKVFITINENLWKAPSPITIEENSKSSHPYNITKVTWNDQNVVYELHQRDKLLRFPFTIDKSGNIYVTEPLDREEHDQYIFYALARNNNGISVSRPLKIEVNVKDINDNPPVCPAAETIFEVQEKEAIGSAIGMLMATDMDEHGQSNSVLRYTLVEQLPQIPTKNVFLISKHKGEIQLAIDGLNMQLDKQYRLKVEVSDEGEPSLSATCLVTINVIDINDHIPIFESFDYGIVTLPEDIPLETLVKEIQATDNDQWGTGSSHINYNIVHGDPYKMFRIDTNPVNNRGYIKVVAPLDYETFREHDLVIDARNPEPLFSGISYNDSSTTYLKIRVTDVDERPAFTNSIFQAQVPENITIGTFLIKINASDPEGKDIRFSLKGDTFNWLRIDEVTGEIFSKAILDREQANTYPVEVIVAEKHNSAKSSSVYFHLYLNDVNDNYPQLAKNYFNDFAFCYPLRRPESFVFSGKDADDVQRPMSLKFILGENTEKDWTIQYLNATSATLTMKHSNFQVGDINVPVIIKDNGRPQLESNVFVPVRICSCINTNMCDIIPVEEPWHPSVGMALGILFGTLAVIGIIIAVVFISINKKKKKAKKTTGVAHHAAETVTLTT